MINELNGDFIQWLRGFYYVARSGSVRKAAELMHRNPSTISYQLHALENELGVILFDRYNKTMRITHEGETLFEWAIATFDALKNMFASVSSEGGNLHGPLKMASTLLIVSLAIKPVTQFIRTYPGVQLTIQRKLSGDVRKDVDEAEVDFGILPVIRQSARDDLEVVTRARPFLIFHRDLSFSIPPVPELNDLEKLPFVAFESQQPQYDQGNYGALSGIGAFIEKNAVIRANNYYIILRLVEENLGVAIMDELCFMGSCFGEKHDNLKKIALDHIFPNRIYGILTRKNKYLSSQARALIQVLKDHFLSIARLRESWDSST